jgi:hypothetical protein
MGEGGGVYILPFGVLWVFKHPHKFYPKIRVSNIHNIKNNIKK